MLPRVSGTSTMSLILAPSTAKANGIPFASPKRLRLVPFFSPIRRVRTGGFSSKRGFDHGTVYRKPGPVNTNRVIVFIKHHLPDFVEYTSSEPALEPTVGCSARDETAGRQRFPLSTCSQNKENGVHCLSKFYGRSMQGKSTISMLKITALGHIWCCFLLLRARFGEFIALYVRNYPQKAPIYCALALEVDDSQSTPRSRNNAISA